MQRGPAAPQELGTAPALLLPVGTPTCPRVLLSRHHLRFLSSPSLFVGEFSFCCIQSQALAVISLPQDTDMPQGEGSVTRGVVWV